MEQFDHNLDSTAATEDDDETDVERIDVNKKVQTENEESSSAGNVMVGLFDSLRDLTQNVGKLVNIVGDRLDDSRGDVVRIATDVDTQVSNLGNDILEWKRKNFGIRIKNMNSQIADEEDVI